MFVTVAVRMKGARDDLVNAEEGVQRLSKACTYLRAVAQQEGREEAPQRDVLADNDVGRTLSRRIRRW